MKMNKTPFLNLSFAAVFHNVLKDYLLLHLPMVLTITVSFYLTVAEDPS